MQERIDNIRMSIDAIRKSGRLPHWRMVYADTLLNRAQDYVAVDRESEAELVLEKLNRWVESHTPKDDKSNQQNTAPMAFWNAKLLQKTAEQIRRTLVTKGMLVPATEREVIGRRLKTVDQWIGAGQFQQAHEELLSLRSALIARLRRSLRARIAATTAYRSGNFSQPSGTLVGLYNAQHTLEETFHIVGERDPIWIEDFLELYNDLFHIVERLVPQDKK